MTADRDLEAVAAVLGAHRQEHIPGTGASRCACGEWSGPFTMLRADDPRAFAHHLAAALLPLIREREAAAWERALREAADKWQTGAWTALTEPIKAERQAQRIIGAAQVVLDWLRDRAAANPYAGSEGA